MKPLGRAAAVTALVLAVTAGGVMAGAFFVSPLAASIPWVLPAVAVVAIVAVMAMITVWMEPATKGATVRIAKASAGDRTPKHVQALAAAGTTLTEIARRTRLPVDAVSMLLSISTASRQLQPPTA